jgi:hypothetical protein
MDLFLANAYLIIVIRPSKQIGRAIDRTRGSTAWLGLESCFDEFGGAMPVARRLPIIQAF